jgi:hypothetical protein
MLRPHQSLLHTPRLFLNVHPQLRKRLASRHRDPVVARRFLWAYSVRQNPQADLPSRSRFPTQTLSVPPGGQSKEIGYL